MKLIPTAVANFFKRLFSKGRKLFVLAWEKGKNEAKDKALNLINDDDLQAAALECVQAAAAKALGGDAAFYDAYANLKARAVLLGKDAARNILETIIQVVYSSWKNSQRPAEKEAAQK